jgi:hypothetical protein
LLGSKAPFSLYNQKTKIFYYYYLRGWGYTFVSLYPLALYIHFSRKSWFLATRHVLAWSQLDLGVATPWLFVAFHGYAEAEIVLESKIKRRSSRLSERTVLVPSRHLGSATRRVVSLPLAFETAMAVKSGAALFAVP